MIIEEHAAGSLDAFLGQIEVSLDKDDIARFLYLGAKQLFVVESFWSSFLSAYTHFLATLGQGSLVSKEKAERKLLPDGVPISQYIFEGKQPLPVVPVDIGGIDPSKIRIRRYFGEPLQTKGYMHPKDPLLLAKDGVVYSNGYFCVTRPDGVALRFSQERAAQFQGMVRNLPEIIKIYPQAGASLRYSVLGLVDALRCAAIDRQKKPVLVPQGFSRQAHLLWRYKNFYFVEQREVALVSEVYCPYGDEGAAFIRRELEIMQQQPRKGKALLFKVRNDGKVELETFHKNARIDYRTLRDFYGRILRSSDARKLSRFTSVKELLIFVAKSVKAATPLPEHRLTAELKEKAKGSMVLKYGGWHFFVSPKGDIRNAIFVEDKRKPVLAKSAGAIGVCLPGKN